MWGVCEVCGVYFARAVWVCDCVDFLQFINKHGVLAEQGVFLKNVCVCVCMCVWYKVWCVFLQGWV